MDVRFFKLLIAKPGRHFTDLQVPAKPTEVAFLETPQDLSQDQPIPAKGGWKNRKLILQPSPKPRNRQMPSQRKLRRCCREEDEVSSLGQKQWSFSRSRGRKENEKEEERMAPSHGPTG